MGQGNGQNSSDDCFNVSYELKTEETHADAEYMALAVIFGLLSGAPARHLCLSGLLQEVDKNGSNITYLTCINAQVQAISVMQNTGYLDFYFDSLPKFYSDSVSQCLRFYSYKVKYGHFTCLEKSEKLKDNLQQ